MCVRFTTMSDKKKSESEKCGDKSERERVCVLSVLSHAAPAPLPSVSPPPPQAPPGGHTHTEPPATGSSFSGESN